MAPRGFRNIEIRGAVYPDVRSAARAVGVSESTIRRAINNGTLARVGLGQKGPQPLPVRIDGRVFASAREAAAHYGVWTASVYRAIEDGDPDRIARAQRYNPARSRPIVIGGVRYRSMRRASIALGFRNPAYVAKALWRDCPVAKQRIIAAAMKVAAQRDAGVGS